MIAFLLRVLFNHDGAQLRRDSEWHWECVATGIRSRDAKADVSWCFRPGRPPFRNPGAPE